MSSNVKTGLPLAETAAIAINNAARSDRDKIKAGQQAALFVMLAYETDVPPNDPRKVKAWLFEKANLDRLKPAESLKENDSEKNLAAHKRYTAAKATISRGADFYEALTYFGYTSADWDNDAQSFLIDCAHFFPVEGYRTIYSVPKPCDGLEVQGVLENGKTEKRIKVNRSRDQLIRSANHRKARAAAIAKGEDPDKVGSGTGGATGTKGADKLTLPNALRLIAEALAKGPLNDELEQAAADMGLVDWIVRRHPILISRALNAVADDKTDAEGQKAHEMILGALIA